jgi:hypothetical protein
LQQATGGSAIFIPLAGKVFIDDDVVFKDNVVDTVGEWLQYDHWTWGGGMRNSEWNHRGWQFTEAWKPATDANRPNCAQAALFSLSTWRLIQVSRSMGHGQTTITCSNMASAAPSRLTGLLVC